MTNAGAWFDFEVCSLSEPGASVRVNLRDSETNLILRKPSGNHHNGALIAGFNPNGAPSDHYAYDMF